MIRIVTHAVEEGKPTIETIVEVPLNITKKGYLSKEICREIINSLEEDNTNLIEIYQIAEEDSHGE